MIGKKILITGADGYIGSLVAQKLSLVDCNLILLSKTGKIPNFFKKTKAKIKIIKGDITQNFFWDPLLKDMDIIFHFAAQTSSQVANNNPLLDVEINVLPIISLIDSCIRKNTFPDIIFAGTVTETGLTQDGRINENHKDLPITIYDIHKLCAEKYFQYYSSELKGRAVILRLPNIYGPGPVSSQLDRGIVNIMIKKALKGEPITIFGDGNYIRDYLYIEDTVFAFIKAVENIKKTNGNYYVIGTGVGHTVLQMATIIKKEVEKMTKKKIDITFSSFPKNTSRIEYRNFIADNSRFIKATGWLPKISLKEGIKKTADYFSI